MKRLSKLVIIGGVFLGAAACSPQNTNPASPEINAIDLAARESANCYIVNNFGNYCIPPVKGNSTLAIENIASVDVLWETYNNDEKVVPGTIVTDISYASGKILFTVPKDYREGNALIAAKDADGTILWSWHIWVNTRKMEGKNYGLTGVNFLPYNLGAVGECGEVESYGLLYQWGRKDPFVGAMGNSLPLTAEIAGTARTEADASTLEASIANPTVLFKTSSNDWLTEPDNTLWGGSKTIYDPCPAGWKVPTNFDSDFFLTPTKAVKSADFERGFFTLPDGKFPIPGYRDSSTGDLEKPSHAAKYWTCSPSSAGKSKAFSLVDNSGQKSLSTNDQRNAYACSVRCVEDDHQEKPSGLPVKGTYKTYNIPQIPELSGLCLSKDKDFLWGVGDQGQLGKITFEGKATKHWYHDADMEDVAINPETGDMYIAIEGSQKVYKVPAPNYNTYSTIFYVQEAVDGGFGNGGLEGLTWYKDDMVFVGSQTGAYVWKYNVKTGKKISKVSLTKICKDVKEVGGLCYDPVRDWLWVTDSEAFKLFIFDAELTKCLASYSVSNISNAESICVDREHSCVWVGSDEDTPKLYQFSFTNL